MVERVPLAAQPHQVQMMVDLVEVEPQQEKEVAVDLEVAVDIQVEEVVTMLEMVLEEVVPLISQMV